MSDNWENREPRERLKDLETRLAAGVIARYLGDDWRVEVSGEHDTRIHIVHRDGYGVFFRRSWQDSSRFESSPLHRYKRDEPPNITTSATRTLGSIAADIERRLVNNGLREAFEQEQAGVKGRQSERRERFDQLRAVVEAWGGRILGRPSWEYDQYPVAEIPGGKAKIGYGFNGKSVEIELTLNTEEAVKLGWAIASPPAGTTSPAPSLAEPCAI
jgi:hypothetical protein